MNSRDRVLAAFAHEEPDRVPIDLERPVVHGVFAQKSIMVHPGR